MHFETRLWQFTEGVRLRMVYTVLIGLVATCFGIARLALLGWLIGRIFAGDGLQELFVPVLAVALVIVIRGALEHWRALVAHATAARVQLRLRRRLFDKMAEFGPSYVGQQRSGDVTLSLVDGVEQLEVYFGQYLPQLLISLLTPLLIFACVAWLDLPVAIVMLVFALIALFAVLSQFSFEAICGMLSLHEQQGIMRENDHGDQFQRGAFSSRSDSDGRALVPGLPPQHTPCRRTHGRTRGGA